jgi:CheY-like chemotaxis protein
MATARILVIDDSLTIRKLVEISLKNSSYAIEFASTGAEGVGRALHMRPDIVLLDFVLPDMKGSDVCGYLAKDERTTGSSVIVMTAKGERVREMFDKFPQVADYLPKPFAPADLVARIAKVLELREAAPNSESKRTVAPTFPFAQKEAAAKTLYSRLRTQLARIPTWLPTLGASPPGPFFATKILTPEMVDDLLVSLLPTYREAIAAERVAEAVPGAFRGEFEDWDPFDVLKLFVDSGRTGRLMIEHGDQRVFVYLRQGEIALTTSHNPWDYAKGAQFTLNDVPREVRERAESEQRASGKPVFIALAEAGILPVKNLPSLLAAAGLRTLVSACAATKARFEWVDKCPFPAYIEPYARQTSLAQLSLERHRAHPRKDVDLPLAAQFERALNFSAKLREVKLLPDEGRVLTLVDSRYSVQGLIDASELSGSEVCSILLRLEKAQLIRRKGAVVRHTVGRPVVLLDVDAENIQRPIARLLRGRRHALDVLLAQDAASLLETVRREHPRLVLVGDLSDTVTAAVRALRADATFAGVSFVAIVEDSPSALKDVSDDLFDEVLTKPFHFDDIERILAA